MKVMVTGSERLNDYYELKNFLDKIFSKKKNTEILLLYRVPNNPYIKQYAFENSIQTKEFEDKWQSTLGDVAIPIRNKLMLDEADALVYFYNGTDIEVLDAVKRAKSLNIPIRGKTLYKN